MSLHLTFPIWLGQLPGGVFSSLGAGLLSATVQVPRERLFTGSGGSLEPLDGPTAPSPPGAQKRGCDARAFIPATSEPFNGILY